MVGGVAGAGAGCVLFALLLAGLLRRHRKLQVSLSQLSAAASERKMGEARPSPPPAPATRACPCTAG